MSRVRCLSVGLFATNHHQSPTLIGTRARGAATRHFKRGARWTAQTVTAVSLASLAWRDRRSVSSVLAVCSRMRWARLRAKRRFVRRARLSGQRKFRPHQNAQGVNQSLGTLRWKSPQEAQMWSPISVPPAPAPRVCAHSVTRTVEIADHSIITVVAVCAPRVLLLRIQRRVSTARQESTMTWGGKCRVRLRCVPYKVHILTKLPPKQAQQPCLNTAYHAQAAPSMDLCIKRRLARQQHVAQAWCGRAAIPLPQPRRPSRVHRVQQEPTPRLATR